MHLIAILHATTAVAHPLSHHPSPVLLVVAGLIGGLAVGITGTGGGALMTPMLVLIFSVNPQVAIASDLVSSLVMKPVGGSVHARRRTVHWALVRRLVVGSVPAALAGAYVLNHLGHAASVAHNVRLLLGWALLVTFASLLAKMTLTARATRRREAAGEAGNEEPYLVKTAPTVLVGIVGGFMVGMTSVGSGSLMIILLMLLYPRLTTRSLVGTDLVQSVPLVAAATLGQAVWGHVDLSISGALIVGSIPGVFVGALLSSRAPDKIVRPILAFILVASGLSLLLANNASDLALALVFVVVTGVPLWAAVDATLLRWADWQEAGHRRTVWVALLGIGAPLGIGLVATVPYLALVRGRVREVAEHRYRTGQPIGGGRGVSAGPTQTEPIDPR
ncbi:MAG: TSUP family transporter [Actinomycetota bacterium]|nr:TSUP family transporter [Actinomycetota bacterium]